MREKIGFFFQLRRQIRLDTSIYKYIRIYIYNIMIYILSYIWLRQYRRVYILKKYTVPKKMPLGGNSSSRIPRSCNANHCFHDGIVQLVPGDMTCASGTFTTLHRAELVVCQWLERLVSINKSGHRMFPKIMVPPISSILIGFSIINHPFWGAPIFGNTDIIQKHLGTWGAQDSGDLKAEVVAPRHRWWMRYFPLNPSCFS